MDTFEGNSGSRQDEPPRFPDSIADHGFQIQLETLAFESGWVYT